MTGSATAAARQALGAYGERLAEHQVDLPRLAPPVAVEQHHPLPDQVPLREGDVLVVCEVKTRSGLGFGTPHEAITDVKLDRLQRLGQAWMRAHAVVADGTRVDLVAVLRPARGPAVVDHVRGVG